MEIQSTHITMVIMLIYGCEYPTGATACPAFAIVKTIVFSMKMQHDIPL